MGGGMHQNVLNPSMVKEQLEKLKLMRQRRQDKHPINGPVDWYFKEAVTDAERELKSAIIEVLSQIESIQAQLI